MKFWNIENKDGKPFKCKKCGKILNNQDEVMKHKKENWNHFEYELMGTKMKLGFA